MSGRRQTTKGIWLALGQKVQEPKTLLLDLEGSDGRERGEDDNSFERQSSLFALAVAGAQLLAIDHCLLCIILHMHIDALQCSNVCACSHVQDKRGTLYLIN